MRYIADMRMMVVISLTFAAYVFLRGVYPLAWKWPFKVLTAVALLGVACIFPVLRRMGGDLPFAPDLPGWFLLTYSGLYMLMLSFACLLFAACIVYDLLLLFIPRLRKGEHAQRRHLRARLAGVSFAVAVLICGMGMYEALCPPRIREVKLQLPVDKPFRLALLSDLHVDFVKDASTVRGWVRQTMQLRPDLIAITGDFVDGSVQQRGDALRPLAELRAPFGVYAVPGNHEYYSGYGEWAPFLRSLGLRLLENEHVTLSELGVVLAGVTDPASRLFDYERPDVTKATAGAPTGLPVILLAHQPQLVRDAERCGVALQLSGHTHGGMILPLYPLVARFNAGYVFGLYRSGNMQVYVNPGTSLWTMMPLRLGVPSEITLLQIEPTAQ